MIILFSVYDRRSTVLVHCSLIARMPYNGTLHMPLYLLPGCSLRFPPWRTISPATGGAIIMASSDLRLSDPLGSAMGAVVQSFTDPEFRSLLIRGYPHGYASGVASQLVCFASLPRNQLFVYCDNNCVDDRRIILCSMRCLVHYICTYMIWFGVKKI